MIINQKRIMNLSKLRLIEDDKKIRIGIAIGEDPQRNEMLKKIGFESLANGETVLPALIGPATRKNASGYVIKHKDKVKEKHYRMAEWTYKKWIGGGKTETVTDNVTRSYMRYPQTVVPPLGIEFTILEINGKKVLLAPEVEKNESNEKYIITAINVILEIFGECEIFDENLDSIINTEIKRLNWTILPAGKYPWTRLKDILKPFIKGARGKNKNVISSRLELIYSFEPNFVAWGNAGFSGYMIFGFPTMDIFVLESTLVNNATYVLGANWEEISKLTKAEIINCSLEKARVIHNKNWYDDMGEFLSEELKK
ncbi:MAG: hypothetical protein PHI41_08890 [Erysipelotrichaceae bacterium]|nr:hypothetical protein [Erysipelotrichaceae bacterium]